MSLETTIQRYSQEEQNEFKPLLLKKINEKKKLLKSLESTILSQKENCHTGDREENVSNELALNANETEFKKQELFLRDHLQPALRRINAGTFGTCRITGKLIPKERLKENLHATVCADVEEKKNPKKQHAKYFGQALNQRWVASSRAS